MIINPFFPHLTWTIRCHEAGFSPLASMAGVLPGGMGGVHALGGAVNPALSVSALTSGFQWKPGGVRRR